MGTPGDMETRTYNIRIDDQSRKSKILKARRYIFKYGASINGVRVKNVLIDESLVPTKVRLLNFLDSPRVQVDWNYILECFF